MRTVGLSELSTKKSISISSVFSMKQNWSNGFVFHMKADRMQSALLWFCGTEGEFVFENGDTMSVPLGALVYIPQGLRYKVKFIETVNAPTAILLEFCLCDDEGFFTLSDSVEILDPNLRDNQIVDIICELSSQFTMPEIPWMNIKGDVYKLLYLLASKIESRTLQRGGLKAIEKGIRYMQFDEEQLLSIEEIAEMCFVTPAYFRKLFRQYAGMSPLEYRIKRKISQAKHYIEHSNMSVAEISEMLKFDNPSYFCKIFKKHAGVTPSEYRKSITNQIK